MADDPNAPKTPPGAYLNPYYDSAHRTVDDSRKGMLEAVAQGGQAGAQAYQQQIDAANADRQAAVARAAQSSALGYASDPSQALSSYDAHIGLLGDTKTNNQAYFDKIGAAGSGYFDKVQSGLAAGQAMAINKAGAQESTIQGAIKVAQEKAAAAAAAEQAKQQAQLDRENRAEARSIARENRASARSTAEKAAKPPSNQSLLGLASQLAKQPATPLGHGATTDERNQIATDEINRQLAGQGDQGRLTDLASRIGRLLGVPESQVNELYSPQTQSQLVGQLEKSGYTPAKTSDAANVKQLATLTRMPESDVRAALGDSDYKTQYDKAGQLLAAGATWDQVDSALRADLLPKKTRSYATLVAQFRPMFVNAGLLGGE